MPIRKFEHYIKGMPHAGCDHTEIVIYILKNVPEPVAPQAEPLDVLLKAAALYRAGADREGH